MLTTNMHQLLESLQVDESPRNDENIFGNHKTPHYQT
jgi:hypothetical protein